MLKDKTDVKPTEQEQQDFICVASFLPLKSWKYIIPFLIMSQKVLKQIKNSKGIINYGVKNGYINKNFWTFSIWEDHRAMMMFVHTEPHTTAIKKYKKWARDDSAFVIWMCQSKEINWKEALTKLETPTYYYKDR